MIGISNKKAGNPKVNDAGSNRRDVSFVQKRGMSGTEICADLNVYFMPGLCPAEQ
jgi:hypothetical protein